MLRKIATLTVAAGLVAAASPALAASELYAGNENQPSWNANREFMRVNDISDANPTTVIASGLPWDGIEGLAWDSSAQIMYSSSAGGNTFGKINVNTGAWTAINVATTYKAWDLAFGPGGVLYGGDTAGHLFSIWTATGQMTLIGTGARGISALAYDPVSGKMYGSNGGGNGDNDTYFFSINLSNGAQTQIGGAIQHNIYGMSIDPATGVLYGAGWYNTYYSDHGNYGTINKTTGAYTEITWGTPQPMNALAFVPEPGTMLLLGTGLLGLGIAGRKKA